MKNHVPLFVVLAFASSLVISCAPKRNNPVRPVVVEDSKRQVPIFRERDVTFTAIVKPQPSPNHYYVELRWSSEGHPDAWTVSRSENGGSPVHLVTSDGKTRAFVDERVQPGITFRYVLGAVVGGRYRALKDATVTLAEDVEVQGRKHMHGTLRAKRLFLGPRAEIVTYGKDLEIDVDEIESDDAAIASFPENPTAFSRTAGRNGGKITIRAKGGRGTLRLFARGENGGYGYSGQPGKNGENGAPGRNGACGYKGNDPECLSWTSDAFEALKRRAGLETIGSPGPATQKLQSFYCRVEPTDGDPGEAGQKGGPGENGRPGGDAARLLVVIDNPTALNVIAHVEPGRGGNGGTGGLGGIWGLGGAPGNPDHLGLCRIAAHGGSGKLGDMGEPGQDGPPGIAHPYCLRLGTSVQGDCSQVPEPRRK